MKVLNKFRATYNNGKEVSKDLKEENKKVVDSIADSVILQSDIEIKIAKESKSLKTFDVWEEVELKEAKAKKTKAKKSD